MDFDFQIRIDFVLFLGCSNIITALTLAISVIYSLAKTLSSSNTISIQLIFLLVEKKSLILEISI